MTNLEKATRYLLTALHPECETWEEVLFDIYIKEKFPERREKQALDNLRRAEHWKPILPKISLAHVLQAACLKVKDVCYFVDMNGVIVKGGTPVCDWQLTKNAQPISLDQQDENVWKAIVDIFET